MLKANKKGTRKTSLTSFIVNFEHFLHFFLSVFIVDFEHINLRLDDTPLTIWKTLKI